MAYADGSFVEKSNSKNASLVLLRCGDFQPVMLKPNSAIVCDQSANLIDQQGGGSQVLMDNVHPLLSSDHRIAVMDISQNRIVLLLEREKDCLIRIAQWNEADQAYRLTDSQPLPEVYLDTYHDGDAVLLEHFIDVGDGGEERLCITIEEIEAEWHITSFTNASDVSAQATDDGYLLTDYYDEEDSTVRKRYQCSSRNTPTSNADILFIITIYTLFLCVGYHQSTSSL